MYRYTGTTNDIGVSTCDSEYEASFTLHNNAMDVSCKHLCSRLVWSYNYSYIRPFSSFLKTHDEATDIEESVEELSDDEPGM